MPATLKHFGLAMPQEAMAQPGLQIMFPPDGAKLSRVANSAGALRPIVMRLEGGQGPYHVLVNGTPNDEQFSGKAITINTSASGFSNMTVIDAKGLVASVNVFLQ